MSADKVRFYFFLQETFMNTTQDYNKLKQITEMQDEIIRRYDNIIIPGYEKKLADLEESRNELLKDLDLAINTLRQQEIEYSTFRKFHEDSYNNYIEYEKLKQAHEHAQKVIASCREYEDALNKQIQILERNYNYLKSDNQRILAITYGIYP